MSHHQFVTSSDLVEIRDAGSMGRGVFAVLRIPAGTLLFSDPVILVPKNQCPKVPVLDAIAFIWPDVMGDGQSMHAIVLGMGTLLNHSKSPNVDLTFDKYPDRVDFYALRDIEPHEQLTHDYGYDDYPSEWRT